MLNDVLPPPASGRTLQRQIKPLLIQRVLLVSFVKQCLVVFIELEGQVDRMLLPLTLVTHATSLPFCSLSIGRAAVVARSPEPPLSHRRNLHPVVRYRAQHCAVLDDVLQHFAAAPTP
jgi:hypothetical protein